jgi:hypothetical protein
VKDALDELSEAERQAITLAYFGGHTYRDVALMPRPPGGHHQESHPPRPQQARRQAGSNRTRSTAMTDGDDLPRSAAPTTSTACSAHVLDALDDEERAGRGLPGHQFSPGRGRPAGPLVRRRGGRGRRP